MEQKLYGSALCLNPSKFFALRDKDRRQVARLRSMFNDVMWKMMMSKQKIVSKRMTMRGLKVSASQSKEQ
jgi:hypothetical protein